MNLIETIMAYGALLVLCLIGCAIGYLLLAWVLARRGAARLRRKAEEARLVREVRREVGEPVIVILPDGRRR